MNDPVYNPATAFGNKELLKRCHEVVEEEQKKESEPQEIESWSAGANEYYLKYTCPCGSENEHQVEYEPEPGDEAECYKCEKIVILK